MKCLRPLGQLSNLVVPVGLEPTLLGNLPMRPYKDRVLTITLWDQMAGMTSFDLATSAVTMLRSPN